MLMKKKRQNECWRWPLQVKRWEKRNQKTHQIEGSCKHEYHERLLTINVTSQINMIMDRPISRMSFFMNEISFILREKQFERREKCCMFRQTRSTTRIEKSELNIFPNHYHSINANNSYLWLFWLHNDSGCRWWEWILKWIRHCNHRIQDLRCTWCCCACARRKSDRTDGIRNTQQWCTATVHSIIVQIIHSLIEKHFLCVEFNSSTVWITVGFSFEQTYLWNYFRFSVFPRWNREN